MPKCYSLCLDDVRTVHVLLGPVRKEGLILEAEKVKLRPYSVQLLSSHRHPQG